jgi:cyclopropane-fatty-acyl-phospholipid synthase
MLPDGRRQVYGRPGRPPEGVMEVRHLAFFKKLFFGADIGLGEAYMAGDWSSPDLTGAMKVMACNIEALDRRTRALPSFSRIGDFISHRRRANTVDGARQNIEAHYDTSNAFFSLILDPTMTYSCALFEGPEDDLHRAQLNKIARICEKAAIKASDHVLEIGTGWGGFAVEAARRTGCAVTTTTISREQYDYVTPMVARLGLSDRIQVLHRDYRHLEGAFDKIVSIEMLEAVGHEFYRDYFSICDALLKPGGRMVFQVITIPHSRYAAYRRRADWIQKYIFPGGMLPSREILEETIGRWTSLRAADVTAIGSHYAPTLAAWRHNLLAHREQIEKLGFDDRGVRMWEYYFASCEAGFSAGAIDNIQMVLDKP